MLNVSSGLLHLYTRFGTIVKHKNPSDCSTFVCMFTLQCDTLNYSNTMQSIPIYLKRHNLMSKITEGCDC